jgi:hypothetical protein
VLFLLSLSFLKFFPFCLACPDPMSLAAAAAGSLLLLPVKRKSLKKGVDARKRGGRELQNKHLVLFVFMLVP